MDRPRESGAEAIAVVIEALTKRLQTFMVEGKVNPNIACQAVCSLVGRAFRQAVPPPELVKLAENEARPG